MSDQIVTSIVTVLVALIGVAIVAVLVSGNAQTANVLNAGGSAFSGILGTALGPVTGGSGLNFGGGGVNQGLPILG